MQKAERVFFLGAGASVPDGYPITAWLVCAVAAFLQRHRESRGSVSRLEQYLNSVYGLERDELDASAEMWRQYIADAQAFTRQTFDSKLPEIIELLSMIDLAIAEGESFGPGGDKSRPREFRGNELVRVRERAVEALVMGFGQVRESRLKRNGIHPVAQGFTSSLTDRDIVITTNWDTLIEEALRRNQRTVGINYGVDVIRVDAAGDRTDLSPAGPKVLKLHGSFSWLRCPRCKNLYANQDLMVAPVSLNNWPCDLTCDCGAELMGVLITPTYMKNYQLSQLSEIWRIAQKSLEEADEWTFIGYSLPTDDLWIRGMLLRAFAIRRNKKNLPVVRVVRRGSSGDSERRYSSIFKGASIKFDDEGFEKFAQNVNAS
ncbi:MULTISPECIES: SIR2 family protein [Rhizobium]|uniref:SIR2 family protein n=1 Tax=Rhizobium TaxID=379 RepID=UPI00102F89AE|nr:MULTISPECIES: SIR2 family protein [Rhizobium]TBF24878.1 hypothetical protein ELG88_33775 [Rhizobium leguminosarum]WSH48592.1 SIR2 family protein [Rhizobium johnstonii]